MNNIDEVLKEVDECLSNEPSIKEYFRLKEIISNDKELMKLDSLVREHQTKMCQNQNNDEIYFKEKALYERYLSELEANPIYQNFNEVKKEVNKLLLEIKNYLD